MMKCWHGYLSAAMCKPLAYGSDDATATPSSLASRFWCWLIQVVPEK